MTGPLAHLTGRTSVSEDPQRTAERAATWISDHSRLAVSARGRFTIAVAGGSTPRELYALLVAEPFHSKLDWSKWFVFFGDERACPMTDPSSNYNMVQETLLSHVPIKPQNVFRMRGEAPDLDGEARRYAQVMELVLGRPPRLDLVLLGMGTNGHTASLFPGTDALKSTEWATRGVADYAPHDRLTLTLATLNAAQQVGFIVCGEEKGDALRETVAGTSVASQVLPPNGELRWFLDAAAADTLKVAAPDQD